jgi:hypothetical protein
MSALHCLRTCAVAAIIAANIFGGAKSADAITTTLVEPSASSWLTRSQVRIAIGKRWLW